MKQRTKAGMVTLGTMLCFATQLMAETRVVSNSELWALFDKKMYPVYPYEARRGYIQGKGLYRMYIDPDGSVRAVGVMKSTGSKILDLAAAGGLGHCHLKPRGKPFEIDMPIEFTMLHSPR